MNFKRIAAAAVASALAAGIMAMSASAALYPIDESELDSSLTIRNTNWLLLLYHDGFDPEKPVVDRGLDLQAINSFTYYTELLPYPDSEVGLPLDEYDPAIDYFGGNLIYAATGGSIGTAQDSDWYDEENGVTLYHKYNWPSNNQWLGLPEKGDTPEGQIAETNKGSVDYFDQNIYMEYVNKFAYKIEMNIAEDHADDEDYLWPEGAGLYQVGLQEWGGATAFGLKVDLLVLKDIDGKFMMAFDELGNEISETEAEEIIEWLATRDVDLSDSSDDNSGSASTPSTSVTTATTTSTAPVENLIDEDEETGVQIVAADGVIEKGTVVNVVIESTDLGDDAHFFVLDITLLNVEGKDAKVVQPNGPVTVKIPLPEGFEENDTYYVYYQADDGTLTDMKATFEDGYVSFVTDHFSTYILTTEKLVNDSEDAAATATTTPAADDSGSDEDKNQATGVVIAIIPAIAAAAGVIISKKRK